MCCLVFCLPLFWFIFSCHFLSCLVLFLLCFVLYLFSSYFTLFVLSCQIMKKDPVSLKLWKKDPVRWWFKKKRQRPYMLCCDLLCNLGLDQIIHSGVVLVLICVVCLASSSLVCSALCYLSSSCLDSSRSHEWGKSKDKTRRPDKTADKTRQQTRQNETRKDKTRPKRYQ